MTGSSPRLRGTALNRRPAGVGTRFIPAPAGNSYILTAGSDGDSVHPRACGEQTFAGDRIRH